MAKLRKTIFGLQFVHVEQNKMMGSWFWFTEGRSPYMESDTTFKDKMLAIKDWEQVAKRHNFKYVLVDEND